MDDAKWEKYAALGGVAFVVLSVVGTFIAGSPPAADDSATEIAEWFSDNAGAIQAGQFLNGLGLIALIWWAGSLFRKMARAEAGRPRLSVVAIVGFVFGGVFALVSGAILSATALRIDEIGEGAEVFYVLACVLLSTSAFGLIAALAAINALSLRTKMLPPVARLCGDARGRAVPRRLDRQRHRRIRNHDLRVARLPRVVGLDPGCQLRDVEEPDDCDRTDARGRRARRLTHRSGSTTLPFSQRLCCENGATSSWSTWT